MRSNVVALLVLAASIASAKEAPVTMAELSATRFRLSNAIAKALDGPKAKPKVRTIPISEKPVTRDDIALALHDLFLIAKPHCPRPQKVVKHHNIGIGLFRTGKDQMTTLIHEGFVPSDSILFRAKPVTFTPDEVGTIFGDFLVVLSDKTHVPIKGQRED